MVFDFSVVAQSLASLDSVVMVVLLQSMLPFDVRQDGGFDLMLVTLIHKDFWEIESVN